MFLSLINAYLNFSQGSGHPNTVQEISLPTAKKVCQMGQKLVTKPGKTTDDIKEHRPMRPRTFSAPQLGRAPVRLTEEQEIKKKSGQLWRCLERRPDPGSNGYIYKFRLKKKYDSITPSQNPAQRLIAAQMKVEKIFPAVEPVGLEITHLDPKISKDAYTLQFLQFKKETIDAQVKSHDESLQAKVRMDVVKILITTASTLYAHRDFLWKLGYRVEQTKDGVYLNLPDRETLLARWEKLKEKMPQLPGLDIVSSEGIAGDMAFIEAYIRHDALLSEGEEFVHDHLAHIIFILGIVRQTSLGQDTKVRWQFVKVILAAYRRFVIVQNNQDDQVAPLKKQFDKLVFGLSYYVDSMTSANTSQALSALSNEAHLTTVYNAIPKSPKLSNYLKKRFGNDFGDNFNLTKMWNQMKAIEQEFDAKRQKAKL